MAETGGGMLPEGLGVFFFFFGSGASRGSVILLPLETMYTAVQLTELNRLGDARRLVAVSLVELSCAFRGRRFFFGGFRNPNGQEKKTWQPRGIHFHGLFFLQRGEFRSLLGCIGAPYGC